MHIGNGPLFALLKWRGSWIFGCARLRNRKEKRRAVLVDSHVIPGVQYHCTLLCVNVIVNRLSPPSAIGPLPPRLGLGSKFPRVEHAHRGGVDGALARAMARARVGQGAQVRELLAIEGCG